MRIPLVRSGGDVTPIAWWEWMFAPIMIMLFFIIGGAVAIASIPYFWLYPERHAQLVDIEGLEDEKQRLEAYRKYRSGVSLRKRLLEKLRFVPFDAGPTDGAK